MRRANIVESARIHIDRIPVLGEWTKRIYRWARKRLGKPKPFPGSAIYWEQRYQNGGNSGTGSYGKFATFKAEVLNQFVAQQQVRTVIEFGCGDGNQLGLANYPRYIGFDVSETAIATCKRRFGSDASKTFKASREYSGETAELTLSLDVLYHLIEDTVFAAYMSTLFAASNRYVVIYSSDSDDNSETQGTHVHHRRFTAWIQENLPDWTLLRRIANKYPYHGDYKTGSWSDLYIYEKRHGSNS